jgi:hypothetical protein
MGRVDTRSARLRGVCLAMSTVSRLAATYNKSVTARLAAETGS